MALYKTLVKKIPISADKKTKQQDYQKAGRLPIIDQGHLFIGGYSDDLSNAISCDLPVIVFGDHTKVVKFISFPFGAGADGIKILQAKENVLPKYLFYGTQYLTFRIEDKGYARHYQHIEKKNLPVPSLSEQERIVVRIEELFSELDKGVETLQTIKQQLKVYRQAVLANEFESHEDWPRYVFGDLLLDMRNGYGEKPHDIGQFPILRISAVRAMHVDLTDIRYNMNSFTQKDLISENDLLFTRYNGSLEYVGVCACVPKLSREYAYPDKVIRCRLKFNNSIHAQFLQYYMNQGEARKYIRSKVKTTSGQKGIAGSDIKKTEVYVPDSETQARIVARIDARLSVCDNIEQTVDKALLQAEAMRQCILKQAFEGRLV